MRTRTLVEIIQDTVGIYQKNLIPFLIVAVVGSAVAAVISYISGQIAASAVAGATESLLRDGGRNLDEAAAAAAAFGAMGAAFSPMVMLLGIVSTAVQTLTHAALVHAADQAIQTEKVDPSSAWMAVAGKAVVLIVVAFVVGILATIGVLLVITIPVVIYLAVRWGFFAQAYLLENLEPMASFSRSSELVAGQWWRVCGIIIVVAIVFGIITFILGAILTLILGMIPVIGLIAAGTIVGALAGPIFPIAQTLLYYDLRARKENAPAV